MLIEDTTLLRETEGSADLNAIFDKIGEAVTIVDASWRVRYINDVYFRYSGLKRSQVEGKRVFDFAPSFKQSIFFNSIECAMLEKRETRKISFSPVLKQWMRVRTVPYDDGVAIFMRTASEDDVTEHLRSESAVVDGLTGLRNKVGMEVDADVLLKRRAPFFMLAIGIEGLKAVNDNHGYDVADMCLLEVSSQLRAALDEGEEIYRLATDELGAICYGSDEDAIEKALKLTKLIAQPIALRSALIRMSACVGVVNGHMHGAGGFDLLLKRCSLALTRARRTRAERADRAGTVEVFEPSLESAAAGRILLQDDLRLALTGGQFALLIQPKVSLATGAVVGGETLLRWKHPAKGFLSPGVFLDAADDIGLMPGIDAWVLEASVRVAKELENRGYPVPISVNISTDSFDDTLLPARISKLLQEYSLPAHLLEVEIPEGALMRDISRALAITLELRLMGIQLSIDDFGTGYSSFSYLAQFPVQTLKIDRSFIDGVESSKAKRTIVRGIITMAHQLSLDVVAEGAEEEAQVTVLKKLNCDKIQGYYFAAPLPFEKFVSFQAQRAPRGLPPPDAL